MGNHQVATRMDWIQKPTSGIWWRLCSSCPRSADSPPLDLRSPLAQDMLLCHILSLKFCTCRLILRKTSSVLTRSNVPLLFPLADPKSATLTIGWTSGSRVDNKTFSGFKSRCIMPWRWKCYWVCQMVSNVATGWSFTCTARQIWKAIDLVLDSAIKRIGKAVGSGKI